MKLRNVKLTDKQIFWINDAIVNARNQEKQYGENSQYDYVKESSKLNVKFYDEIENTLEPFIKEIISEWSKQ